MMIGFDCDISFQYRQLGITWKVGGRTIDLMRFMSLNGSSCVRVGVGTNETGPLSIDIALKSIRWARQSALMADVFFYLSSIGADLGKQPAPIGWETKSLTERASLAREHLRSCATVLVRENCTDHLYEVGNEIDYGVCGSFVSDATKWPETPPNIDFLKSTVWRDEALILKEAIAGLREADPKAKVILHLAHWWNLTFCLEFYGFMKSQEVLFDYAGISYYPSSGIYDLGEFLIQGRTDADRSASEFKRTVTGLVSNQYEVVICEFAYPSSADIAGMFSSFNKQLSGYSLDANGQASFIEDTLVWLSDQDKVVAAFYFAPHFYKTPLTDVWGAFALFGESGEARPGLFSIGRLTLLEYGLGVQREARESLILAWEAIETSDTSGKTEGLEKARHRFDEAWRAYLSGMFDTTKRLALEATESAKSAVNPGARAAFLTILALVGPAAAVAVALVVLRLKKRVRRLSLRQRNCGTRQS